MLLLAAGLVGFACTGESETGISAGSREALMSGSAAAPGQFPYVVSLRESEGAHACGGTAIAPDLVMTAHHCVTERRGGPVNTHRMGDEIIWGRLVEDEASAGERVFRSQGPFYVFYEHDVVVVSVAGEVVDGELEAGAPIPPPYGRLPLPGEADPLFDPSFAVGWGGATTSLLFRSVNATPFLLDVECNHPFPADAVTADRLCHAPGLLAGGDSGSPLVSEPVLGESLLFGVVSGTHPSGGTNYDVYADLLTHSAGSFSHEWRDLLRGPHAPQQAGTWQERGGCYPELSDAKGYATPSFYSVFQAADIDMDGDDDVVSRESDGIHVFLTTGSTWIESPTAGLIMSDADGFSAPAQYESIRLGEFSGDGFPDLVSRFPFAIVLHFNNGAPPFFSSSNIEVVEPAFGTFAHLLVLDANGDGVDDVVEVLLPLGTSGDANVALHLNDGSGEFDTFVRTISSGLFVKAFVGAANLLHGNGVAEELILTESLATPSTPDAGGLAVLSWNGADWDWYVGPPGPAPAYCDWSGFGSPSSSQLWSTLRAGHLDGPCPDTDDLLIRCADGLLTLSSDCGETPFTEVSPGSPRPLRDTLPYPTPMPGTRIPSGWDNPSGYQTIRLGNVDGGSPSDPLDVVARTPSGMVTWLNDGSGRYQPASVFVPALTDVAGWDAPEHFSTLTLADLDGDGDHELVVRDDCGLRSFDFM